MSTGRPELSAVPCSLRWTAPEILRHAQAHESPDSDVITPACDVYSYGMLMWEICTTLDPFSDVTADEQVREGWRSYRCRGFSSYLATLLAHTMLNLVIELFVCKYLYRSDESMRCWRARR